MRVKPPTSADIARIHAGFVAAGLDPDFLNAYDIERLWNFGYSVERIVQTAVSYSVRSGTTAATGSPS